MDTVAHIMTTQVRTAKANDVIGPIRELMIENHIGCVPIVDDNGTLQGVITSSDLVEEWSPNMGVVTVMSRDVFTAPPHRAVTEAAREMVDKHVHHLVVAEHGVVLGVVSAFDMMMLLAGRLEQTAAAAGGSTPAPATAPAARAKPGDRIVVRGGHVGDRDRRAVIEEVRGHDGGPPYMVRWLNGTDERQHLYFPGSDAIIEPKEPAVSA